MNPPAAPPRLNGQDLLELDANERAVAGLFLSFQYPLEIPGVPALTFVRTALNAQRRAQGLPEASAPEFLKAARAGRPAAQDRLRHAEAAR
jgi:Fe-S cluster assembly ATP-binding protein